MRRAGRSQALLGAAAALLCLLPAFGLRAQERRVLGLTTRNGTFALPYVVAAEKGFFRKEGLDVAIVVMQNQVVVNGVLSRNVEYGGTFQNFVGAAVAGLPVRIVMAVMEGSDHVLVTSPSIRRVEDLKGKVVGISSFGGLPHSQVTMILRKHGMSEKDVTFLQIGGSASRYAALEGGSIQAAMLTPPFNLMARKRGFRELLPFNDIVKIPMAGLAVHVEYAKERPDEIVKMIKAVLRAIDYIRANRPEILALMEKDWGLKDRQIREEVLEETIPLYTRNGTAPDETMKNLVAMVLEARKSKAAVPLSAVADRTFAKRAVEELRR